MAEIKWIKLTTDMFDNRKIKHLRRLPDGNNVVLIWVMLLSMAGRCNAGGMIFLTENIQYTTKMLADELDFEENTVILALKSLEQLNMIVTDNGFFKIAGWEEYQNIEGMERIREQTRKRVAKHRENLKEIECNVTETLRNNDVTQQNKNKNKNKKEKEIKTYSDDSSLNDAIISFMEYRKSIKKPMTDKAVALLIKKLDGMTSNISEQIEILNQSIVNGWQGIFPLKQETRKEVVPSWIKKDKFKNFEEHECNYDEIAMGLLKNGDDFKERKEELQDRLKEKYGKGGTVD